jgi:ATP-binding cassette subfamily F protein uup
MRLDGKGTVMEEVSDSGEMVRFGEQTLTARAYLRRFLFEDSRVTERVDKLSGGERARLLLAKVLCRGGNVIVLDEPTNDLDLASLRMLEEALADFDGTILVVSHDRYFLDRICDQIVAFEEGGVYVQPGNFSYYLEKKSERERRAPAGFRAVVTPAVEVKPAAKTRRLSFREQQELDGMEQAIQSAEEAVSGMEALLNDPAFYAARAAEAPDSVKKLERARSEVARLYARWEELSGRI